jgi:uncharacterized protein (TIRG00374 family)
MVTWSKLQGKLIQSLIIGIVVVLILSLFSDIQAVGGAFRQFAWAYLPIILLLTVLNYVLRWVKWEYYLRVLGMRHGVNTLDSVLLFTAGMTMAVTPGKIGEVFKSYLLKRVNNTPISESAPIVLVERVTDGLAMLLLLALGLTLYPLAWPAFIVLVLATFAGIAIVQNRPLCDRILMWFSTSPLPMTDKVGPKLVTLYVSTYRLLDWRVVGVSTLISFVSWGCECVAFYYVLVGLGVGGDVLLLQQATFIFAASTLLGLVSFLPGGLGMSELSSVGLLVTMVGMSSSAATAATIIIRFGTLWFGVGLGVVALLWFRRRHRPRAEADQPAEESFEPVR